MRSFILCTTKRPGASARDRRGTAAVEFAVVLPVLMLIVLATIDLSRLAHASYTLSNALRAGAEVAATKRVTTYSQSQWESEVELAVQEHLQQSLGQIAGSAQIDITTTPVAGDMTQVTLQATLPLEATADWPVFGGTYEVNESFQIRQYR
jgi:Flp pilus assembly protein TadG